MTENQFWWATVHNHDRPEVVEVTFEDGKPHLVHVTGTDIGIWAHEFEGSQVRLIERVLPAGRAAAAVAKLSELIHDKWPWVVEAEVAAILQVEEDRA